MSAKKNHGTADGFTFLEFVLVLGIIAILAAMAVPALMTIVPQAQLRGAARSTANLLQQARLLADNSQKPARLSLDCRPSGRCQARLDTALFLPDGSLRNWAEVPGTKREFGHTVRLAADAGSAPVSGSPSDLYWAVFMPTGQMRASHDPLRLIFSSTTRGIPWELTVNSASGRATLKGLQ